MENIMEKKQGRKLCPKCNTPTGARTLVCKTCGSPFIKVDKVHKDCEQTEGRGHKKCPSCNKITGVRAFKCVCGYDFTKKQEIVKPENVITVPEPEPDTSTPTPNTPPSENEEIKSIIIEDKEEEIVHLPCATPDEHADRIIGFGKERAKLLLSHSKISGWKHVNWDKVREFVNAS